MSAPQFPSTLLPQSNHPQEIQKGMLDLLSKVNQVSSAVSSNSANISITTNLDMTKTQYNFIFADASSRSFKITLPPSSSVSFNEIKIVKGDTSANIVTIVPSSTDKFTGHSAGDSLSITTYGVTFLYPTKKQIWITSINQTSFNTV